MNIKPIYYPGEIIKIRNRYNDFFCIVDWIYTDDVNDDNAKNMYYIGVPIEVYDDKTYLDYLNMGHIVKDVITDRFYLNDVMLDYIMKDIDNNPFKDKLSAIIDVYNNGLDKWFNKEI